jgi:short subunit fatty acids transporter
MMIQGEEYLGFVLAKRGVSTGSAETKNTPDEVLDEIASREEAEQKKKTD